MRPIAKLPHVAWCVWECLSVCWSHECAKTAEPIEMQFKSCSHVYLMNRILHGIETHQRKGQLLGWSGPLLSIGNPCCGKCSKGDNSILNNGTTAALLQPTAMFSTARCHIALSQWKIEMPCDANALTTCWYAVITIDSYSALYASVRTVPRKGRPLPEMELWT